MISGQRVKAFDMTEGYRYLISYPHDAAGRANSYECTWHESFDACFLCSTGERDLIELLAWSHGVCAWSSSTDHGVYADQYTSELSVIIHLGDMDLNTTVFELQDRQLSA